MMCKVLRGPHRRSPTIALDQEGVKLQLLSWYTGAQRELDPSKIGKEFLAVRLEKSGMYIQVSLKEENITVVGWKENVVTIKLHRARGLVVNIGLVRKVLPFSPCTQVHTALCSCGFPLDDWHAVLECGHCFHDACVHEVASLCPWCVTL